MRSLAVPATHLAPCRYPRSAGPLSEHLAALASTLYLFPVRVSRSLLSSYFELDQVYYLLSSQTGSSSEPLLRYDINSKFNNVFINTKSVFKKDNKLKSSIKEDVF